MCGFFRDNTKNEPRTTYNFMIKYFMRSEIIHFFTIGGSFFYFLYYKFTKFFVAVRVELKMPRHHISVAIWGHLIVYRIQEHQLTT